jgi:hypothetical protein
MASIVRITLHAAVPLRCALSDRLLWLAPPHPGRLSYTTTRARLRDLREIHRSASSCTDLSLLRSCVWHIIATLTGRLP